MREIKFRGKPVSDVFCEVTGNLLFQKNQWVYGNLIVSDWNKSCYIVGDIVEASADGLIHEWWVKVDPSTVMIVEPCPEGI